MKQKGAICLMRTKVVNEYITDALFDLLKVKELNKISILELIKKAGVCRSSFYRNYFYLEDVIRIYLDDVFERILSLTSIDEICNQIKSFFYELLQEREKLGILAKRNLLHLLDKPIYRFCVSQMTNFGAQANEYKSYLYAGSSAFLIRAWIRNDFKESPERLAEITLDTFRVYLP